MTNPSAQTMLADEIEASEGIALMDAGGPTQLGIRKTVMVIAALRAASAPAAVQEALVIVEHHLAFQHKWLHDQFEGMGRDRTDGTVSADTWDQLEATYSVWKTVKRALATPEEASTAAGEAETTEQIVQRVKEACAQVADRFVVRDLEYGAIRPDDMVAAEHRAERGRSIAGAIRALIPAAPPSAQTDGKLIDDK